MPLNIHLTILFDNLPVPNIYKKYHLNRTLEIR